ncbi:MAG: V-type ATP synthase subunit D [Ruminococcus bromii]|nr:V-type ATP synthase subunit D [Acutalibacteraceae bacterium]MEE0948865.1 V-type ATP synthase subunit D [Bacteroidales bacterium]MEE0964317.1 V-type ATP synthase subunit D [Ruminococcus bromii]MEE1050251.1 V-type ATP synthase subunit D [Clostridia bacterium]MEE1172444.1 V-type ATP synthase subunit D [Ruminococcus sp.]
MAKIKLTKNELKVQKDALKMYRRYLPTLTLKKQQLQSEIRTIESRAKAMRKEREDLEFGFREWIAVFSETDAFPQGIITVSNIRKGKGNIAGVDIPTYEGADFSRGDYDLYETPLWVDIAANHMEKAMSLDLEAEVLEEQIRLLEIELLATSQRVNLFEKVKIPETEANIKKISIYMADQQVSAVVRSKISKRKIALRNAVASEKEVYSL